MTGKRPTVYLANPYGFSKQLKARALPEIVHALEKLGIDVWEPFERNNQKTHLAKPGWPYRVAQANLRDVRESDATFAVVNGTPPDEGVMMELGIATALGKPTFLFRDDFRRAADSDTYPLNLMIFVGLPEHGWEAFYYTSINEIASPDKALVQWLSTKGQGLNHT